MSTASIPEAIDLTAAHLRVRWPDHDSVLEAAMLRAECRCAHCRAAVQRGERLPIEPGLTLANAEPVGQYALQLSFSDGHARGIYPWSWLRELSSRVRKP